MLDGIILNSNLKLYISYDLALHKVSERELHYFSSATFNHFYNI